jgi:hypothetical protein
MACCLLPMILGGCLTDSDSYRGSAEATRAAATPAGECQRVAKAVAEPLMRPGQDARHVIVRFRGRLALANRRIAERNACADTPADRAAR